MPKPYAAVDFETYYDKECSVIPLGTVAYTLHPRFNVYMVSIFSDAYKFVGHPKDADWNAIKDHSWLSHNAGFDQAVYNRLLQLGQIQNLPAAPADWYCTSALACYLGAPRDLAGASRYLLGRETAKDMRNWMLGKTWEDCVAAGKANEMLEYAAHDAELCFGIWQLHNAAWPESERLLSNLTYKKGAEGIYLDSETLEDGIRKAQDAIYAAEGQLPWINLINPKDDEPYKPTSTQGLARVCQEAGIPPPKSTAEDSEECDEWEKKYANDYPWVGQIRIWRKANKLFKLLQKLKARTLPDNTITYSLKYFGAHTGRWSGDAGFNVQNLHKGDILGVDIRKILRARPGKKFIICDLSQIEPRVLAWACQDEDLLKALRNGLPIYEAHARATMGWNGGRLKTENAQLYALAKARVLALGYGCGAEKFIFMAKMYADLDLTLRESKQCVDDFRRTNPKILNFWCELENHFKGAIIPDPENPNCRQFNMQLPSGRTMKYRNVSDKHGWSAQVVMGDTPYFFWGGKLCENFTQATSRDVFGHGLLELEKEGIDCRFHVHDEFITEVDMSVKPSDVVSIVTRCPPWLEGCPIEAEAFESDFYTK